MRGGTAIAVVTLLCALNLYCSASQSSSSQPDLSGLSSSERAMVDSACNYDRQMNGPAAYYGCLRRQLAALQSSSGQPDLSGLSNVELATIASACNYDRQMNGPAAYYRCLRRQLNALQSSPGQPDLSGLSSDERAMVGSACNYDRQMNGPAAYYGCLRRQLAAIAPEYSSRVVARSPEPKATPSTEPESTLLVESKQQTEASPTATTVPRRDRSAINENQGALRQQPASSASDDKSSLLVAARIASTLKEDEAQFCQDVQSAKCRAEFLRAIHYRPVTLSPSGKKGLIVELSAQGFCGSGGCAVYVLNETADGYTSVLEDLGSLDEFQVATSTNNGYYDVIRHGKMTDSDYKWSGVKYVSSSTSDSSSSPTATPAASTSRSESSSDVEIALWFGVILVIGVLGALYKRAAKKKCILCGNFNETIGAYCPTCTAKMADAARRAAEQRAAEERARVDEERRTREKREQENRNATTLADLNRLTGPQFEALIASLFKKDGYTVRHCGGSGDEGIDLVLIMGQEKDVVQCKRWKNDIGSPVVRDFYGALMHAVARHGFIITTASFSQSARDFARGKPISLIGGAEILRWINGSYSSRDQRTSRPKTSSGNGAFDPYAVLGISRGASPQEIRAAYHRQMVNYHPDKVAHLGKELQELAKTKSQRSTVPMRNFQAHVKRNTLRVQLCAVLSPIPPSGCSYSRCACNIED